MWTYLKVGILCLFFSASVLAQDAETEKLEPEPPRRLLLPAPYQRFNEPRFTDPPPPEQPGAAYEDEIERYRRQMRNPPPPPPPPPVRPLDPFQLWEPPAPRTGVQFHVDASVTQRDIFYWRDGNEYRYGTLEDLKNRFLRLPPPPAPPPYSVLGQIWQNNPPPNIAGYYTSLLQFLQAGPGPNGLGSVGNLLTVAQLQQVTPSLLALAPLLRQLQSGSLSLNQLALSPQAGVFLSLAQSILQPLGMWNSATLYAWAFYIASSGRQKQLISILTTLEANLLAALNLPPGQYTNIYTTAQPPPINPYAVINEMNKLWEKGDEEEIAARYPDLAHSLIRHLGFTRPQGVLYGNRQGRETSIWPYNVGIITEQRDQDHREIWVLNESGFFVNETASGVGRYYQGPDDLTLSYLPFEVSKDKKITTLDVRASEDYTLLKRAVGGDVQILNRAATDTTGILYADLPFWNEHLHLRPFVGTTAYATTAGAMLRLDYGTELFQGHIGGGAGYRQTMFSSQRDDWINYLETENIVRTPYLSIWSPDGERGLRFWPSLTLAASSMLTRPLGEDDKSRWTLQAEARLIPELHTQLATPYALFAVSGGVTTAIVPGGNLNLKHPERTLSLYPIRSHVEFTCRIKFSDVIEPSPYYLELGGVTEFSQLVDNARIGARFGGSFFYVDYLTEIEKYHDSSFTDVRVGGGAGCFGVSFLFLQSVVDNDYRAQISIDVTTLIALEDIPPSRGLLDSYGRN